MSRNLLAFFSFLLFISTAAASTLIYWPGKNSTRHSTALSACQSYNSTYVIRSTNPDGSVACGSSSQTFWTIRQQSIECEFGHYGTSCLAEGEVPQCQQDTSGSPIVWSSSQSKCTKYYNLKDDEACNYFKGQPSHQEYTYNSNDPNGATQHTDEGMKCGMDMTATKCTTRTDGTHRCTGRGVYNGDFFPNATDDIPGTCSGGRTDCTEKPADDEPEDPVPQNSVDQKPCIYTSSGGALQCESTQTTNNEGTKNCGTVDGAWKCVPKAPTSNGIVINSKVTSQTNPDGSTTTTKTDTATQTKCTNIGICTSKTTTSTTTTNKDPNGNTTSVTGTCKGDNCPDVNTNPDGNGDGFGDCVGDDCGEEGGNASPPTDAELGEVKTFGESTNEFLLRARSAPIVSALADIRAPSGGNCTEYQVDTYLGTLEYDSHCILIEEKRSLITLIVKTLWALLATWIVLG